MQRIAQQRIATLIYLSFLACAYAETAPPAPINAPSITIYGSLPTMTDLQMSPDGKRIAVLTPLNGVNGLAVIDVATQQMHTALVADPARFQIEFCRWANETRLICRTRTAASVRRRGAPMRLHATSLIAVDHDGKNVLDLLSAEIPTLQHLQRGAYLSLLPADHDNILMPVIEPKSIFRYSGRTIAPDVMRVNIYDGSMKQERNADTRIFWWLADDFGEVRIGVGHTTSWLRVIAKGKNGWHTVNTRAVENEQDIDFLHVSGDGSKAIISARMNGDRLGLYELDLDTGAVTRTLLSDPRFDVSAVLQVAKGELQAAVVDDDRVHLEPFTDDWKKLNADLQRALPNENPIPWSYDDNAEHFVIRTMPNSLPSTWYLYDAVTRRLVRIVSEYPKLQIPQLPITRWVSYRAHDGESIPARLTLPSADAHNLPTILLPHGGPIERDVGTFDWLPMFLASRGYAVLQPQFRGSFGYGAKHRDAGFGQWGLAMQDDVMDGLSWLRAQGIAHPRNACIVGISYGGYAAMVGAFKSADQLRCAVNYAGVADLQMFEANRTFYQLDPLSMRYLNLSLNAKKLTENSPVQNAARFNVPVLFMHAALDVNVLVEQSRALDAALTKAGKSHRYIEQANGDHYLGVEAHRIQFLTELDAFLRANIEGDRQTH